MEIAGTDATTALVFKVPSGLRPADQCGRCGIFGGGILGGFRKKRNNGL